MKITLKAARINQQLNLKEASKKLGIADRTLWSYENGLTFPKTSLIKKIEQVYNVEYNDIIFLPNKHD